MALKTTAINLVRVRKSFIERFISWALTFGRVVVIVTEGVALAAFLYRFGLDQQIIDLHDQIKQKQVIITLSEKNEETYRSIQDRLTQISQLSAKTPKSISVFSDIASAVPSDIHIDNFTINSDSIRMDATTTSLTSLASFTKALQSNSKIASLSLDRIENRTLSSVISFGITMALKN